MNFDDYFQQGVKYFKESNFSLALENMEKALKLQPDNNDVKELIGMLKNVSGIQANQANVEQSLSTALADEIKHRLGSIGKTDAEQAITELTNALKNNQNNTSIQSDLSIAYYIRGLIFMSKKNDSRAIEAFNEAIKIHSGCIIAYNKRGMLNLDMGNFDQAIDDYEEILKVNPEYNQINEKIASAYIARGISFDKKGDYLSAIFDFKKGLQYNPEDNAARELLEMADAALAKENN